MLFDRALVYLGFFCMLSQDETISRVKLYQIKKHTHYLTFKSNKISKLVVSNYCNKLACYGFRKISVVLLTDCADHGWF